MTSLEKLGKQYKMERIDRGLTQEDLARSSRVSISTIGKIEAGSGNPSISTLDRIALNLHSQVLCKLVKREYSL